MVLLFVHTVSSVQAAMQHKHGGAAAASLLPECQGTSSLPSPHCSQTPTPAFDRDGRLWLAFTQNGHIYVTYSDDLGQSFEPPVAVNRAPEAIYSDGENRPKLALGPGGEIYVSWTHKSKGRFAGQVRFARSVNGAKSFDAPLTVNDDLAPISHRFDSMVVDGQGRIYITWIDKRDQEKAKKAGKAYTGAALYYAVSVNDGRSFAFNRKLVDHSCQCCRIAMAVDDSDQVLVLWRHIYPVNIRDHAITRLDMDSMPITGAPVRATDDDWRIDSCPHHGPDLSAGDNDKAHMVWFTKGIKNRGLMYGRFDMAGQALDLQHSIDASSTASRPRVLNVAGRVITAWKAFTGNVTELRASYSVDNGAHWSAPAVVAQTTNGSDQPFLVAHEDKVYASWHTLAEGYRLIPVKPGASNVE